jgi:hypothetical protein
MWQRAINERDEVGKQIEVLVSSARASRPIRTEVEKLEAEIRVQERLVVEYGQAG